MINEKKKLPQIILRIDDKYGHHVIRKNDDKTFSIEGYYSKPDSYALTTPCYFLPFHKDDVKQQFLAHGKEFIDS